MIFLQLNTIFEKIKIKHLIQSIYLPKIIVTDRLILIPFTTEICKEILENKFNILENIGLKNGKNWPDKDFLDTLPKIIFNLSKVTFPSGFESWIIIKKETNEIIGDVGFKGFNMISNSCDIGYGIIEDERKKGFAIEATSALINWVLKADSSITITAATHFDNDSSIKLLKNLNFEEINRDEHYIYWEHQP